MAWRTKCDACERQCVEKTTLLEGVNKEVSALKEVELSRVCEG